MIALRSLRLTVDLMAEHVEDDGATGELWLPRPDYLADPDDIFLTTVTLENPYLKTANDIADLKLTYAFDKATLQSISGYAGNLTRGVDDCAGLPPLQGCVRAVLPTRYEQRSQELHLSAAPGASVEWIVGLFFLDAYGGAGCGRPQQEQPPGTDGEDEDVACDGKRHAQHSRHGVKEFVAAQY